MRWSDVDLGERVLRVERSYFRGEVTPPKSSYGRHRIRLSEELARGLWTHQKPTQGRDGDLVFTGSTGSWLHAGHLADNVFRPAATGPGCRALGFHGFRHTCAASLFRESANVKQVRAWLGHHSPAFTLETYVHLLPRTCPSRRRTCARRPGATGR